MADPAYRELHRTGELARRAETARRLLEPCTLCPHRCGSARLHGEAGRCGAGRRAVVASWQPHFGEEECLVGENGSGTLFFAGCNLACVFCQNHDISRARNARTAGQAAEPDELAGVMLDLQRQGCENLNLVSPSHVLPQILESLDLACGYGLKLPLVWNSGGYDAPDALRLLRGVVDIYMPDAKIWDPLTAETLLGARNYPETARKALAEMHAQVGPLAFDERGRAVRGLLVRHLVLPDELAGTGQWMEYLATSLGPDTYLNLMGQYRPCAEAEAYEALDRQPTPGELARAAGQAADAGIRRLDRRSGKWLKRAFK